MTGKERAITMEPDKTSWEETYRAMAAAGEDWGDFDSTVADGLD